MKRFMAGVLVFLLAACISTVALGKKSGTPNLVITQFPEGRELARWELGRKKGFSLSFIHSVSKTLVVDVYEVRINSIVQTREYFRTHGAGLPSNFDEPHGLSWEKNGDNFILHMERPIPKLVVRTDRNYQNRLIIGKDRIDLNQWEDQALLFYID
ncbi:MAG: DUF1850 domain-containing protein [Desulfobacteraceae bacterium]|nr:DUF1850 domain-containing protein [Desulfobacteraceae bacterium]